MGYYLDKVTNEVYQTSDITLPDGSASRMTRRMQANPDRYKPMTDAQVEAHLAKIEKAKAGEVDVIPAAAQTGEASKSK